MEALLSLFAVGAIGFWILIGLSLVIFTSAVENETFKFSIVWAALLLFLYYTPIVQVITLKALLLIGIVYLIVGTAWSIFKWMKFVHNRDANYRRYIDKNKYTPDEIVSRRSYLESDLSPERNKSKIIGWIAYWPFCLLWSLTRNLFTGIYDLISEMYSRIVSKEMSKL